MREPLQARILVSQQEASLIQTPAQLRFLFARVVLEGFPAIPLWDHFRHHLSQDYIVNLRSEEDGVNEALLSIEKWFTDVGKSIVQYGLPQPHQQITELLRALTRLRVLNLVLWAWKPRSTRLTRLIK